MKRVFGGLLCAGLVLALVVAGPTVRAESEGVLSDLGLTVTGDLNYSSIYMWRGIMLDGDPVLQPGMYVATAPGDLGVLKVGFWASHDMSNTDALKSSELDFLADYTYSLDDVNVSVGHTYYSFPDLLPSDGAPKGWSRELYLGAGFPKLPLAPSVYWYYDYGKKEDGGGEGTYTVLNLAYSVPFTVKETALSLDLAGHVGHNNKQFYKGKGGDAALTAGVTIPLTKSLTCKPNVSYSVPWGNVSDKGNGNQKNRMFTGAYFAYTF